MGIKVSSAKAKGRNFQKFICEKISEVFGIDWGYEDDKLIQPRIMGQKGVDIVLRGEMVTLFPYDVECKATENIRLYADIKQARTNMKPGRNWLLFHKRSHEKPIVIMDAEVFFRLTDECTKAEKKKVCRCE